MAGFRPANASMPDDGWPGGRSACLRLSLCKRPGVPGEGRARCPDQDIFSRRAAVASASSLPLSSTTTPYAAAA